MMKQRYDVGGRVLDDVPQAVLNPKMGSFARDLAEGAAANNFLSLLSGKSFTVPLGATLFG